jgi:general nucleoside transport system ATP-binding protein
VELHRRTIGALSESHAAARATADHDATAVLALENVVKRYGAYRALDQASLDVRPGTVHALLGENGAGKSTLMRIAYGLVRPDAGSMRVRGVHARVERPADAIALGIGMVHQHFTLVPVMTVAENVALGSRGMLDVGQVATLVREIAERTGFALDPAARIESLSVGAQQRVEIAKALAHDARILILDEPTAVLAPEEADALLDWLRTYADAGNAVVLITHKLREALSVADDVTVLRRGRTVLTQPAAATTTEALASAMLGEDPVAGRSPKVSRRPPETDDRIVFRAQRLRLTDAHGVVRVREATFDVRAGEIVGIAGIDGSGQRELLRALAGRLDPDSGELVRPIDVGFIPEDRHHDAVLLDRNLTENVALRGAGVRRGAMNWGSIDAATRTMLEAYDVRAPDSRVPLRALSGGNQQKLVVARELRSAGDDIPHAIVAENPTRGLDVRATADIHDRLRRASEHGAAVVIYSNDIDEVLLLSSRVLVVRDGLVQQVALDRDAIGRAMLGAG